MPAELQSTSQGQTLILTLRNPERRNAIDPVMYAAGVEALGVEGPNIDAEIILLAVQILQTLGLKDLKLKVNSVGCPKCRPLHREKLQEYFRPHLGEMCKDCQSRFDRNPLRLLDCKNPHDQELAAGAPSLEECLCEECKTHFEGLKELLTAAGVDYVVDHNLVRGLDYYNLTVFEWVTNSLGAQGTVCGGGRYDGLVEQLGGQATPAVGFAMGMERLVLLLETLGKTEGVARQVDVYVCMSGDGAMTAAFSLAESLRDALPQLRIMTHCGGGNFKKQFKRADKVGAEIALILGEAELASGEIGIKYLREQGEQQTLTLDQLIGLLASKGE